MSKKETLQGTTFGERTAEDEGDELEAYFVETDEWRRIYHGDVDVVYGPKGSGKSAIYSLLMRRQDELFDQGTLLVPAENVRGALVFQDLVDDPPSAEEDIRRLWKLYFLTVIGSSLRELGVRTDDTDQLISLLEEVELLPTKWNLKKGLRAVRTYLARLANFEAVEAGMEIDPIAGTPSGFKAKVTFGEPSQAQRDEGYVSAEELLRLADEGLNEAGFQLWIVLDRLDVAFAVSPELEANALRALFRVYLDLLGFESLSLKIFLRDDIWQRISAGGFREASHITRAINIKWNRTTLLNLVVRRLLRNDAVAEAFGVVPGEVLEEVEAQQALFDQVFPEQIDVGPNKPAAFDWMLSRVVDGSKENVPRELIHLLSEARRLQLERLEIGHDEPDAESLFDRGTFREALPEVSRVRLENTLYAEYPEVKPWLEALEREKTEQFPETLATIWGVKEATATERAERLVQVGFFEQRGSKREPSFWVPFLYRPALDMSQGSAR